jgi:hypothetical protein
MPQDFGKRMKWKTRIRGNLTAETWNDKRDINML